MDLKNWASTLASRGQKLARESMEYVNQKIDKQTLPHSVSSLFQTGASTRVDLDSATSPACAFVYYTIQTEVSPPPFSAHVGPASSDSFSFSSLSFSSFPPSVASPAPPPHFNAFLLPEGVPADAVTFSLFTSLFPVPGHFVFRFKVPSNAAPAGFVWRHLSREEEDDFVPCFHGAIVCQAVQIPADVAAGADAAFSVHACSQSRSPLPSSVSPQPVCSRSRDGAGGGPLAGPPGSSPAFSEDASPCRADSPKPAFHGNAGFGDLWSGEKAKRSDAEKGPARAYTQTFASGGRTPGRPPVVEMPNREDLVADRISRTESRIQEKLQEAQERRQQELSKQQERLAIPDEVQTQLEKWAKSSDGKYKDVRTLLCTVHEVLWPGADWEPVSISTLMIASQLKKHYRKALLLTHPDKHHSSSAEQLFRAEKIFQAFNEAFKVHPP
ncbi:protein-tyrosine-phosphatase [Toxoplasma gondii VEG]|uniref:Protein-tyrosine-phosphatase n=1 Tax=Toxoplasma gondii (strain ATCC 50861 / VEG) TaxID=432359 RepID=V5B973_TOXGV|nr:protein-tyrosine-phosphatase [Toxoplasma gondii VEG]CEL74273.1 TPA: protein-tyrosine-phosphatase [Toxoplasma gondii VEG]